MPDLRRFVRETAGASYYREQPLEILRFARSKAMFARHRSSPDAIIAALGFDVLASRAGLDRWAKPLGEMVERIDRVNRDETDQGAMALDGALLVYSIVRSLEPALVIETGVASGVSTAFIGAALLENGHGNLISVDLPPIAETVADGTPYDWVSREVGWAIPDQIRHELGDRHELVLEDVRTALPRLLEDHGTVDFFLHDDLHTPAHMGWEYDLVWPVLSPGGVLMSDDVNHAWLSFAAQHGLETVAAANTSRLAAVRKAAGRNASEPGAP
jgi:predicted O-methyltransferase YrrM